MSDQYRHFIQTMACQECNKIVLGTFKKTDYYFATITLLEKSSYPKTTLSCMEEQGGRGGSNIPHSSGNFIK